MKKRAFFCLLALAAARLCAQAGADIDTAIASAGDKIREALPAGAKVAVTQFSSDSAELSAYLSSNMETTLRQNGFVIVERNEENLKKLNAELDYQYSGAVNDALLVEIGRQAGAQYLAYGYFEQLGTYLSLYVRVTNVETAESPVIETMPVRATPKLNELLGATRELVSAGDYIEEIARCRAKRLSIQRERDKEIEKAAAAVRAKYQTQINAVNKQERDPWDSAAEFDARKKKQVADIEKKRDTEITGETERLTIQYNNQLASVEISEREIKSKLEQQQFKLAGENQVQALLGKFDAESKPKHWPASIKSLDELVPYKASDKLAINDADLRTEYQAIEGAKTSGQIAGEITYCIVPHTADNDFDVRVLNYKIYNSDTHAVYLNKSMDTAVRTIAATTKVYKTPAAGTSSAASRKKADGGKGAKSAASTATAAAQGTASASQGAAAATAASPANARVGDTFGVSYFFLSDSTHYTLHGAALTALSSNFGHFYIDWLNAAIGAGDVALFADATVDVGAWLHLFAPVFAFVKGGIGAYYLDYTLDDDNSYADWKDNDFEEAYSTVGAVAKIGAGLEVKLSDHIKLAASYDLHFLLGAQAVAADSFRVGICFGSPVRQ